MSPKGLLKSSDETCGVDAQRFGDCNEFDHVDAPFASLVLRDKGLVTAETPRQVKLCKSGRGPSFKQHLSQALVLAPMSRRP
jgi:hypothetical protein